MSSTRKLRAWHHAFGVPAPTVPTLDAERVRLRFKLLREEIDEAERAALDGNVAATVHELTDVQYVLDGTFVEFGVDALKVKAFNAVHKANMSKLGEDGRPVYREDGKVMKGPKFKAADIAGIMRRAGLGNYLS